MALGGGRGRLDLYQPRVGILSILFLAFGLSMDAMAVSASRGLAVREVRPRHALIVALYFGGFQALMPLLGFLLGDRIGGYVAAFEAFIAFGLLTAIGGKMLYEALQHDEDEEGDEAPSDLDIARAFSPKVMLPLAVATSIDAFAAGLTLPMLGAPMVVSLITIGVTTGILSALGLYAGRRFGAMLGKRLDALGGLVLIGLGLKVLITHLVGA
jgi:putative Mn2+ efflux pump MntP